MCVYNYFCFFLTARTRVPDVFQQAASIKRSAHPNALGTARKATIKVNPLLSLFVIVFLVALLCIFFLYPILCQPKHSSAVTRSFRIREAKPYTCFPSRRYAY